MPASGILRQIIHRAGQLLYAFAAVFLVCFAAWGAGITVPSGSVLSVKDNNLNVSGDVVLAGTLTTTTGTITLDGSWLTSGIGAYLAGNGTVHFAATAADPEQVLVPGTVTGDGFYHFIHDGTGTVRLSTNTSNVYGEFTNSAGTFNANSVDMSVYGNWSNTAAFTSGTGTVNLLGTDQGIYGSTNFYNLTKQLISPTSHQLTLQNTVEQQVQNNLTIRGYDSSIYLALRSDLEGTAARLTLSKAGQQNIRYVDVKDNNASGFANGQAYATPAGLTLVGRSSPDHTAGWNNTNWLFNGVEIKWDGSNCTSQATCLWNDPYNWNLGLVPGDGDSAVVRSLDEDNGNAAITFQPVLTTDVQVKNLEVRSGASITLDQHNLTVDSAFTHVGNLILDGNETVTAATLGNNGTFTYTGSQLGAVNSDMTHTFVVGGSYLTTFYNLVIAEDPAIVMHGTFITTAPLTVSHDLSLGAGNTIPGAAVTVSNDAAIYGGVLDLSTNAVTLTTVKGLAVSNATLNAQGGNLDAVDVSIYGTTTIFSAPSATKSFTVSGNFTNTAIPSTAFNANAGTLILDGTDQSIYGQSTFYNLTKALPAGATAVQTLTLESGKEQKVTNRLTLTGLDDGTALTYALNLQASVAGSPASLTLVPGGLQSIRDISVVDNNAAGVTLLARGLSPDHSDPVTYHNTNWLFGGVTFKWDGSGTAPAGTDKTNWDNPYNWDLGAVPESTDTALIRSALLPAEAAFEGIATIDAQPHLTSAVSIGALTLRDTGSTLNLDGHSITVAGALSNLGNIIALGSEAVRITAPDTQHGTFTYLGNDSAPSTPKVIKLAEPSTNPIRYYNLVIADTGTAETFTLDTDAAIYGSLSVSGGSLNLSAWNVEVDGGLYLSGTGSLVAPGVGSTFQVAADFSNTTGSSSAFSANGGTVTLNGVDQTIYGSTDFFNLTKVIPAGASQSQTLTFQNNQKQTVTNRLMLTGLDDGTQLTHALNIRAISSTDPRPQLVLKPGGAQVIRDVDVQDNDASPDNGVTLVARGYSPDHSVINTYHAVNWAFGSATLKWDGSGTPPGGTDPTDWDNPYNWNLGFVPQAGDTVIVRSQLLPAEIAAEGISSISTQPHLTTAVDIGGLTLRDTGSILTLDGYALTDTGALTNYGNIVARGSETIRIAIPDIQHGTFTYIGDDTAPLGKTLKLAQPSVNPLQYFNLVIADAGASQETFTPDIDLAVYGNLSVSGGTLNLAAINVDVNGGIYLTGGNLTAPAAGLNFTVGAGWLNAGGVPFFSPNGGRVTFDSTVDATIYGSTTFNNLSILGLSGKNVYFEALKNQTVLGDLSMTGGQDTKLVLHSTASGSPWTITVPSLKIVTDVDVQDSIAAGPNAVNIMAFNSVDRQDSGGHSTNLGWMFGSLKILYPATGSTIGQVPVLIGQAMPSSDLTIVDQTDAVVATVKTDANGNFRVVLGYNDANITPNPITKTQLAVSTVPLDTTLTPVYQSFHGNSVHVTVVASPTTSQAPVITSPADQDKIVGSRPTIQGSGTPGATVTIIANDAEGNLLLTMPPDAYAGQGIIGGDGHFSVRLTRPVPRGTIYISAVVNGVSSPLMTYTVFGLYGVVFDSSTNQLLKDASVYIYKADGTLAVPDVDLATEDTNPLVTGANGVYRAMPEYGSYYIVVAAQGYKFPTTIANNALPADRSILNGSKGEVFPITAVVSHMDLPMDASNALFKIEKTANKSEAKVGEVVTYSVSMESLSSSNTVLQPKLYDVIPPGFKFINGRVLLDNVPLANPTGNRPLTFAVGDFNPRQKKTVRYQLVIGSGVVPGTYENTAYMKYQNGLVISNTSNQAVKVIMDPLFDMGTVFGKVFYDYNENGRQDEPDYIYEERREIVEGPVPNVRIVMEDGTIVTTDKNGQFHIPQLLPGRHLLRVDERTLPAGSYVTTDKAQVIDITPGSIVKLNFGINMDNAQVVGDDALFFQNKVRVEQDTDAPKPRLNVDTFNNEILLHNDAVIEQIEFRIFMNYTPFIQSWRLDIVDQDTKRLVRSFTGTPINIRDPIYWDGRDSAGKYVHADRKYSYFLKVEDGNHNWDETVEKSLTLRSLTDQEWEARNIKKDEQSLIAEMKEAAGKRRSWITSASKLDISKQRNITVAGETVHIDPLESDVRQVRVLKDGQLFIDVPVAERHALTAMELAQGTSQQNEPVEIILPNGDYELEVMSTEGQVAGMGAEGLTAPPYIPKPDIVAVGERALSGTPASVSTQTSSSVAEAAKVAHYRKPVKVGEDHLLFVALGDGKVGYNVDRGNIEPVQSNDKYRPGFYHEGKMAYYLKGKVRGKYLVTSSFDTDRQQKEMFRGIKEDQYYPIYGDSSSINYEATNTQGPLFLLVEWDKSQAIWGNYAIDFNDTEFAKYTRTLYGGKVDYTSVASTQFGDPRTKVAVFHSQIRQRSAHAELLGTGGSLYYLKHQGVVPGSDTIKLEVRDSVTGQVRSTTAMKEGVDYHVDYSEGRILFWQPVSMAADSGSIIANNLLSGDPVYVVADYEYYVNSMLTEATHGARVAQAVTDKVTVGGTYVSETQTGGTYQLQGEDVTVKLARDSAVRAEYAETQMQDSPQYVSTDGGITFSEVLSGSQGGGRAYGIRQDSRLFYRVGLASYYKWIDPGFSTAATAAQQGKELKGINLVFDLTPVTRLTTSYDIQRLIEQGNLQTQMQVGAQETRTTAMQLVHEARRLRLTWEFRNQQVLNASDRYVSETNHNKNTAAMQAQYTINDKTDVTLTHQADFSGDSGNQTSLAFRRRVTDNLIAFLEESFGSLGTGTKAGVTANVNKKLALTTEYGVMQHRTGERVDTSTVALDAQVGKSFSVKTAVSQSISSWGSKASTSSSSAATSGQVQSDVSQTQAGQTVAVSTKGQITDKIALETSAGVTRAADGTQRSSASVQGTTAVDNADIKAGVESGLDQNGLSNRAVSLGASRSVQSGSSTSSTVKLVDSVIYGKETVLTLAQQGQLGPESQLTAERSFGFGRAIQEKTDTYKITRVRDGRKLETSWGRNYAEQPTTHSSSNIFGLTGDINDKWAANGSLEKGRVQNADGSITDRLALAGGVGYVRKDPETGTTALQSSTKVEARFDSGGTSKTQYLVSHATEGRMTEETTLTGKFEYSQTKDNATEKLEAQYKEIVLGMAYRPINNDRLNLFGKYTYKDSLAPQGQANNNDIEASSMHVLTAEGAYDITDDWQIVERLAYRIMEEKVAGFDFYRTHTWLLVNRLNYRVSKDWKVGGEYRVLTQREAKDSRQGFLLEATHSVNSNVELGIGYNFTQFIDDLTSLDYTVAGPFIRMTGKLYDRTPEERARARALWIDRRVEYYAWKMVSSELKKSDSPILKEFNDMYRDAGEANRNGDLEKAREIYKNVVLGVQMMLSEASQFVRGHISFEEKLYNAQQRAREYYDKGDYWMAKKIWEKIVEEASAAMLK
ncbi:MAG: hypothetical protein HGA80_03385 [Candidatus Omnitrophica bacterium]|nr:hypothetical protein [Candidatus Omnitrophota bacterium]